MKISVFALPDLYIIEPEPIIDNRGLFARVVCQDVFGDIGIDSRFVQQSISVNKEAWTLRGMHWQSEPKSEAKLVRVTAGRIFDVVVDVRPTSKTFRSWAAVILSASNRKAIYIPKGFAHGFQTLEKDTEVLYQMSERYDRDLQRSFRWNDPEINIKWPKTEGLIMSESDRYAPNFKRCFG